MRGHDADPVGVVRGSGVEQIDELADHAVHGAHLVPDALEDELYQRADHLVLVERLGVREHEIDVEREGLGDRFTPDDPADLDPRDVELRRVEADVEGWRDGACHGHDETGAAARASRPSSGV